MERIKLIYLLFSQGNYKNNEILKKLFQIIIFPSSPLVSLCDLYLIKNIDYLPRPLFLKRFFDIKYKIVGSYLNSQNSPINKYLNNFYDINKNIYSLNKINNIVFVEADSYSSKNINPQKLKNIFIKI